MVITLGVQRDIVDFARSSVARSISVSRYTCDAIPASDRHNDTRRQHIRASIASRGKNCAYTNSKHSFLPRDAMLSAVYAVVVCLSHSGIVLSKRLNVGSRK